MKEAFVLVRHGRLTLTDVDRMTRVERAVYMGEIEHLADEMKKAMKH